MGFAGQRCQKYNIFDTDTFVVYIISSVRSVLSTFIVHNTASKVLLVLITKLDWDMIVPTFAGFDNQAHTSTRCTKNRCIQILSKRKLQKYLLTLTSKLDWKQTDDYYFYLR